MPSYDAFPGIEAWASVTVAPPVSAEVSELVGRLRNASAEAFSAAAESLLRMAAVDTGAIELLYATDRGFTMTVATAGTALDSALSRKPEAANLIRDQITAYEYVLDIATGRQLLSESAVRELHAVLTKHQDTYDVTLPDGRAGVSALPHGEYKKLPNNPTLLDGSVFAYADPIDVSAEMGRLIEATRSPAFAGLHTLTQSAFLHYSFVRIHPFVDGNGRVARALASWPTYRDLSCPVMVFADERDAYLDSLEAADMGRLQTFSDYLARSTLTGLRILADQTEFESTPSVASSVQRLREAKADRGGVSEARMRSIASAMTDHVETLLLELAPDEPDLVSSQPFRMRIQSLEAGWLYDGTSPGLYIRSEMVAATYDVKVDVGFRSSGSDAGLRVRIGPYELRAGLGDIYPATSRSFDLRLRLFISHHINLVVAAIAAAAATPAEDV